jgi:hypothetical protein
MARIHRLSPEAAYRLAMQTAQQVGLPVQLPQVQQGISQLIAAIYQQLGVFWAVDDTSPYFQNIVQQFPGLTQNTRQTAAPGNGAPPPQAWPAAPPAPPQAWPSAPPPAQYFQPPVQQYPTPAAPIPSHAIFPGRPLPDLPGSGRMPPPPPGMQPGRSGMIPMPGGPVPVAAPIAGYPNDAPPSMTEAPPSPSIILE